MPTYMDPTAATNALSGGASGPPMGPFATVIPPGMVTQDNVAGKVITPETLMSSRVFHPTMPQSYGAGLHKLYTPSYQPIVPPIPSAFLNLLRKGMVR